MEVTTLLCDLPICRLCGENNDNGTNLYETGENKHNLSEMINKYLPIKVEDDGRYPRTLCPGCTIQLEATKLFFDLIVEGQQKLREMHAKQQEMLRRQEKQRQQLEDALKMVNPSTSIGTYTIQEDEVGEKILIQILSDGPLFTNDHEMSLKMCGLDKPKRKRGRPPKQANETAVEDNKENMILKEEKEQEEIDVDGDNRRKRRIKVPSRYQEVLQGKELDRIFKEEGVIDEDSLSEDEPPNLEVQPVKNPSEIIGHMEGKDGEDLGELVIVNKAVNKFKIRNKNNMQLIKKKKKYECNICSRVFSHANRLEIHKSFHREINYVCDEEGCMIQTESKKAMEEHQEETDHTGFSVFESVDPDNDKDLESKDAPIIVETAQKIENDKIVPPSEKVDKLMCKDCGKRFTTKQNLDIHVKAIHDNQKPFKCDKCDKVFPYLNSYKTHMLQHNEKIYPCEVCSKIFNHPSSLVYHREAEHNNGRRFVCLKCKKTFKHKQLLLRHQLVHSNLRPHQCRYCEASFKTRANLINHMPMHTGERKYYCKVCPQTFAHKTSLTLHMRWHDGTKPYKCDVCLKQFSQKGNLAEHKRIHTGEKPYGCPHCDKKFTTSSQYKNHVKRHTGEKPWQCEYCSKTFFHKDTWKSHIRRHNNERPFQCSLCLRAFNEQWALKKHMRLHTGEKPYTCEFCNRSFADSSNLAKHKKTHLVRLKQDDQSANIKIVTSENGDKILYLTCDDDSSNPEKPQTVMQIMEDINTLSPVTSDSQTITMIRGGIGEETVDDLTLDSTEQLQQVIDNDGNPLSVTTPNGEVIKVVMTVGNGQQAIQGLLNDDTLVPINLVMQDGKLLTAEILTGVMDKNDKLVDVDESIKELQIPTVEQLLDNNSIQFLTEDGQKLDQNIQFLSEDGQNFYVTYQTDDTINPAYLTMS